MNTERLFEFVLIVLNQGGRWTRTINTLRLHDFTARQILEFLTMPRPSGAIGEEEQYD